MNFRFLLLMAGFAAVAAGCGSPAAEFRRNQPFAHKVEKDAQFEITAQQRRDVDKALLALFGTPDEPALPALADVDVASVLDLAKLKLAAGPVGSDEAGNPRGLYREHCAHCHGITGDGNGPTAGFLNPYPRDYRKGQFKFKSTPIGSKPTHDDLKRILIEGIPGTAMPSFKLLHDQEVEALIHYVKYLSIRGEVERGLLRSLPDLEGPLVSIVEPGASAEAVAAQQTQLAAVKDVATDYLGRWASAYEVLLDPKNKVTPRPKLAGKELEASRLRGRDLFYGTVANCVKCHGESALGDGQQTDYDEWTKEFIGDGKNLALRREFVSVGMPEPRNIKPRNLRQGIYRGGLRPIDIFWRIRNGIEGTPMPASTLKPAGDAAAKGLTQDDIWDIVNYVQSLPYESISNPFENTPSDLRERM